MAKLSRVAYDLFIYMGGLLLVSVSWVLAHSRNHPADTIYQAIYHSRFWLLGIGVVLAIAVMLFRPSSDP